MKRRTILLSLLISILVSGFVVGGEVFTDPTVYSIEMEATDYYYTGEIKGDITIDCFVPSGGGSPEGEIEVLVYGPNLNETFQLSVDKGVPTTVNLEVYFDKPSSTDYVTVYVSGEGLCEYQPFIYYEDSNGEVYLAPYHSKPPSHPDPSC